MNPTTRLVTPLLWLAAALSPAGPGHAADLSFVPPAAYGGPPYDGGAYGAPGGFGHGGFRVAPWATRPAPLRYDVYGYPLPPAVPNPLAAGGCPSAVQPIYDTDGNLAGYGLTPLCR